MLRVILFLSIFLPLYAEAGGSVSYADDIAPLVAHRPDLARKLEGYQLAPIGAGLRIGWQACPALAGKRIGPYEVAAVKDGAGSTALFHTRDRFFDAGGTLIAQYLDGFPVEGDDIGAAAAVQEELVDITFAE